MGQAITITTFGRSLVDDVDAVAARNTLALGSVDNTSDANKVVSTAQQTALDLKANITSPTFITSAILGGGDGTASPLAFTARGSAAAGANIAGAVLTIDAGNGTGTGGSGSIIFRTAAVAGSSSTPNTLAAVLTLDKSKVAQFEGSVQLRNGQVLASYKADGVTLQNLLYLDSNNDVNITTTGGLYFGGMNAFQLQGVASPNIAFASTSGPSAHIFLESSGLVSFRSSGVRRLQYTATGLLTHTVGDAATNSSSSCVTWSHNTSGTAAANFGSAFEHQLQSSTTANVRVVRDFLSWVTATHASRVPQRVFYMSDFAGEREVFRMAADGSAAVIGFGGVVVATTALTVTSPLATYVGLAVKMAASPTADALRVLDSSGVVKASINKDGIPRHGGSVRLVSDVTNATTTMANMSDLTVTLIAGRKYRFRLQLYANDSVAIDGAKVDFDGGSATMTSFRAHGTVFDTALLLSSQVNAIATDFVVATVTGDAMVEIYGAFVVNAAGTFIPRVAQNSHTTGTITAYLNSHLVVEECAA